MNPWDVLITDPFYTMAAKTIPEQGWALQRLRCHHLKVREPGAKIISGCNGPADPVAEIYAERCVLFVATIRKVSSMHVRSLHNASMSFRIPQTG